MTNDELARHILRDQSYAVLATADAGGRPWASPVWFAMEDPAELFWISYPGARHSENVAERPAISMVVFDSTVPPGTGQAVYMSATAAQVTDPAEVERGMAVFSRESTRGGGRDFGLDAVTGEARLRLYRAAVEEHWILDPDSPHDVRTTVHP